MCVFIGERVCFKGGCVCVFGRERERGTVFLCVCVCVCVYIYILEKERKRETATISHTPSPPPSSPRLHDRKICVLGMCTLLQLGPERLGVLKECHKEIIPAILMLFQGLKRAYAGE